MRKIFIAISMLVWTLSSIAGDVITLNDGKSFDGKVTRIKDCSVVFRASGHRYVIPAEDISTIQFANISDKVYIDYLKLTPETQNMCLNGRTDAENFHGKKGGHFALGVLFGPFAMIGTAISNPTPEKGKDTFLMSNNKDQFSNPEYLSCYRKKAKGQLIGMEAAGWGAWILLLLVL